jgi:hypothetical protein
MTDWMSVLISYIYIRNTCTINIEKENKNFKTKTIQYFIIFHHLWYLIFPSLPLDDQNEVYNIMG